MPSFSRLLAPLACARPDPGLLRYVAMLCRIQRGARLDLVHVSPKPWGQIEKIWKEMEAAVGSLFDNIAGTVNISYHVLEGDLTDRLLEFASDVGSDVIVVGHQARRRGRRSLARRLAQKAPCSVWMVPEGSPASLTHIIAPIDFSERSADSLAEAIALAALAGLKRITVLHVHHGKSAGALDEWGKPVRGHELEVLDRFLGPIELRGVEIAPRFVEAPSVSEAVQRLVREENADLVVMGTRGRSRAASVLLGSETEQVMIESHIPVLVVKHFGASRSLLDILLERRQRSKQAAELQS
jgi:nucleotide-binding universal stress UspA family protein